jgi:hypothetical protein
MLRAGSGDASAADDSRRAYVASSGIPLFASIHADVCARLGLADEARALVSDAESSPAPRVFSMFATALGALGDLERAATWLERAKAARCAWWPTLRVDPRMQDALRHPAVRAVFEDLPRLPDSVDPLDGDRRTDGFARRDQHTAGSVIVRAGPGEESRQDLHLAGC